MRRVPAGVILNSCSSCWTFSTTLMCQQDLQRAAILPFHHPLWIFCILRNAHSRQSPPCLFEARSFLGNKWKKAGERNHTHARPCTSLRTFIDIIPYPSTYPHPTHPNKPPDPNRSLNPRLTSTIKPDVSLQTVHIVVWTGQNVQKMQIFGTNYVASGRTHLARSDDGAVHYPARIPPQVKTCLQIHACTPPRLCTQNDHSQRQALITLYSSQQQTHLSKFSVPSLLLWNTVHPPPLFMSQ